SSDLSNSSSIPTPEWRLGFPQRQANAPGGAGAQALTSPPQISHLQPKPVPYLPGSPTPYPTFRRFVADIPSLLGPCPGPWQAIHSSAISLATSPGVPTVLGLLRFLAIRSRTIHAAGATELEAVGLVFLERRQF